MPEDFTDVHADPTQDHLSVYASDEAVEAAEQTDLAIQKEHFEPEVSEAGNIESVDGVEAPAPLFHDERGDE